MVSILDKNDTVLELGYGDGVVTRYLYNYGANITILEGSSILVRKAKNNHPNLDCIHTLFENYNPKKKYNVILALHILEHVDNPISLLKHLSSLLTKDGKIIIAVPNSESIHRQIALIMKLHSSLDVLSSRDLLVGHKRVYSHKLLLEHISKADYKEIEFKGFFLKVIPNSMMLNFNKELILALNEISSKINPELCANMVSIIKRK